MKIRNLMTGTALLVATTIAFMGCSSYDDEDATIIAYLKINDMLEKKLAGNSANEIAEFMQAYENATWENMFDFDEDAVVAFVDKYYNESNDTYNLESLEADITSELWNYFNMNYSDAIPSKAQNTDEGRYYTITELKAKYSDYQEWEIEGFSPMELVNSVMSEKLFDYSFMSEGDVNLRTLYVFYLFCKDNQHGNQKDTKAGHNSKPSDSIDYTAIIASHFNGGIPADVNVNEVVSTFKQLTEGEYKLYENTQSGFEQFANDYFGTDMFSGEGAD